MSSVLNAQFINHFIQRDSVSTQNTLHEEGELGLS